MRLFIGVITAILCALPASADTLIRNVTAITMDKTKIIENAFVLISEDRIRYIGDVEPRFEMEPELIIDGTGKFLVPGLAEMHGHLPSSGVDAQQTKDTLFLYLAGGVTTVRGMLGDPVQFEMRDAIKAGEIAGPTLYLAAPSLNGNTVSSPEDGAEKARRYHAAGYDLLKIHPGLTRAEYDAIATTANSLNMPFGGHVPADVGIERAFAVGQISLDHMDGYITWLGGDKRIWGAEDPKRAVYATKASGTWIVPTQELFNTFYSGGHRGEPIAQQKLEALKARPENVYVPKAQSARWARTAKAARPNSTVIANRQALLKAFADAGVNIAMGSDAPQTYSVPGFSIWREIEVMVEAGLTPAQIMDIGTNAAGRYFKDKDTFGTITVGSRADLLLLDADPRLDAANLFKQAGVMAGGRWYSREMIDTRLADIAAQHR